MACGKNIGGEFDYRAVGLLHCDVNQDGFPASQGLLSEGVVGQDRRSEPRVQDRCHTRRDKDQPIVFVHKSGCVVVQR